MILNAPETIDHVFVSTGSGIKWKLGLYLFHKRKRNSFNR